MAKDLATGIGRRSRSSAYAKRSLYKGRKTGAAKVTEETPAYKEVPVKGDKNGSTRRVPTTKAARYYPAEDVSKPKVSRKSAKPTKLRSTIQPGTILILLAGRFRGKRVVFLKQLDSGLLLVTGPFKLNGVPLRRVNQAYVIATSTKVDFCDVKISDKVTDAFFAKDKKTASSSAEDEFFADGKPKEKAAHPEDKTSEQKSVDAGVLAGVKKTSNLEKYLKATWGLSKGQFPHELVF